MEFSLVKSETQIDRFQALWEDFCEEKNIPYWDQNKKALRFLLFHDKKPTGTIQFAPFHLNNPQSEIEKWYQFSTNEYVQKLVAENNILFELSKLSIKKDERGKGHFKTLISLMAAISRKKDINYCMAVVSERLYLYIISNGFPCEKLEDEVMINSNTIGIPIVINVKECMEKLFIFPWYRDLVVEIDDEMLKL